MPVPDVKEKTSGTINVVTIGATAAEGGSRARTVTIGGETGLPMLEFEATYPNRPAFALEVSTAGIDGWHEECTKHVADVAGDIEKWAARCEEWGADLVCLELGGAHPDRGAQTPEQCADAVKRVLGATGLPLIVWGTDVDEVDANILPKCTQAAAGENCLFGTAKESAYRTLAASCLADNHKIIAEAPSDINLSKQLHRPHRRSRGGQTVAAARGRQHRQGDRPRQGGRPTDRGGARVGPAGGEGAPVGGGDGPRLPGGRRGTVRDAQPRSPGPGESRRGRHVAEGIVRPPSERSC